MLYPDADPAKALGSGLVPDPAGSNISGSVVDPDPARSKNSGSGAPLVQILLGQKLHNTLVQVVHTYVPLSHGEARQITGRLSSRRR